MQVDPMFMRLVMAIQGLQIHIKTKGKMKLTRIATPKLLREIATEFTEKKYARSEKGNQAALDDLLALKEKMKTQP